MPINSGWRKSEIREKIVLQLLKSSCDEITLLRKIAEFQAKSGTNSLERCYWMGVVDSANRNLALARNDQ